MMPNIHIWSSERTGYDEIPNEEEQPYPYFPKVQGLGESNSSYPKNDYASTLELSSSLLVSPLRVGETTSTSFLPEFPLDPPLVSETDDHRPHLVRRSKLRRHKSFDECKQPHAHGPAIDEDSIDSGLHKADQDNGNKPRLRRSLSLSRRSKDSGPHPHLARRSAPRRQRSFDDAKRLLGSKSAHGPDSDSGPRRNLARRSVPSRQRSLDDAKRPLGSHGAHGPVKDNTSTDSGNVTGLEGGNHQHLNNITAGSPKNLLPTRPSVAKRDFFSASNHSQKRRSHQGLRKSLSPKRTSGEKRGDLNKSNHSQKRRHQQENLKRRSDPELKSVQAKSTSVEGTDGCCIIKRSYGVEKPRSFQDRTQSNPIISPPERGLKRSSSHRKTQSRSPPPPRGLKRSSSHRSNNSKSPPQRGLIRSKSEENGLRQPADRGLKRSSSHRSNNSKSPPQRGMTRSKSQESGLRPSPPDMQRGQTWSNANINQSNPAPPQLTRSKSHEHPSKSAPRCELLRSESRERLETKLEKLEEMKAKQEREAIESSYMYQFKLKPPPEPKLKGEISAVFNQANQRCQRYSPRKLIDSSSSESSDDEDDKLDSSSSESSDDDDDLLIN